MYRIVLVDDEPLILAGIASLLDWEAYDCTIVGKATNGPTAFELIKETEPDIVITDIRMPVMDGLELVEKCKADGCSFAFIVLTNLEEFHLVRKALALGASDYLVKLDLNESALAESLDRAKEAVNLLMNHRNNRMFHELLKDNEGNLVKNCFRRLLLTGETLEQLPEEIREQYPRPFVLLFSLSPINIGLGTEEEPYDFHQISQQMLDILGGIASRFFLHYCLLEYRTDTFLLAASLRPDGAFDSTLKEFCPKLSIALKTYFELSAVYGISSLKDDLLQLPEGLKEAQTALEYYYFDSSSPVVFYQGQNYHVSRARKFNINMFKKDLSSAFTQNDSQRLKEVFDQLVTLFQENRPGKEQATSACINIYTYMYSFFETEDNSYQDIFPYTSNIAEQLNHFKSLSDILTWLETFCGKLCRLLNDRKTTRSDMLVEMARAYIEEHYQEKLTLSDISENLNISAGHLSSTFKKLTGTTLSDYIAAVKINRAKELIDTHQYLMYEISDMLGFDNPYYFSKVFKKVTGISPREHENRYAKS
ncbi:MAG: response regulator [Lachnospiraceae bacterium]|nr:response regulator [Lachnospiraceae bacterium]